MLLMMPSTPNHYIISTNVYEAGAYDKQGTPSPSGLHHPIQELRVGVAVYNFIRQINLIYSWDGDDWQCWAQEFGGDYVGHGKTPDEAFLEWRDGLHVGFQRLYGKRPFEMSQDECTRWARLVSLIDIQRYRNRTPVKVREIGEILYDMKSRPNKIRWITGHSFVINPENVPPELMACKPGQWIEAEVERDPVTHQVMTIDAMHPISFRIPTTSEVETYWINLPKAESSPKIGR